MKLMKYELARAIDKLKSVVQKNEQIPALSGILVKDGYLTATNTEIAIQIKLEAAEGESFIIPMKAFDLIKNLPEGELEVSEEAGHIVTIRMDSIRNSYRSFGSEQFRYDSVGIEALGSAKLNGKRIMDALDHVVFAAAEKSANVAMTGIYFAGNEDSLRLVALNGQVVATESINAEGISGMKLIVPKPAVRKLLSMGMEDDVEILYNDKKLAFRSADYTIYTRLIEGEYFSYDNLFKRGEIQTFIERKTFSGAMARAKMCTEERTPAVFEIVGNSLDISLKDATADYHEKVELQTAIGEELRIGFDSRLVLDAIKAFTCDSISMNFNGPLWPMMLEAEDSDMKVVVLPVRIR